MTTHTSGLARFFDKQREIIEAAETPFAKLAIFVLPVLSPIVPASLTGLHLYKLLLTIFTFKYANEASITLALISAIVLELLGYVGAISFIQSVFRLVRTKETLYILPATLNGLSYIFYLVLMFLINYQLGIYFQTPGIINSIVGILSFVTVPTGLLAANHLSQKEEKEERSALRRESREERLERLRIKQESYQKVSGKLPDDEKVSSNLPVDWRKIRPTLNPDQVRYMATSEPKEIVQEFAKIGVNVSPRTASNWKSNAMKELGIEQ